MEEYLFQLRKLSILISGQALTSRTETVEDYLKNRVKRLGVIAVANPYHSSHIASRRFYENGALLWEKPLGNIHFRKKRWCSQSLLIPVFLVYLFSILRSAKSFGRKFDIFIGISCFSAAMGLLLKKLGIVGQTIYYSIDYYRYPEKWEVNNLIGAAFRWLDKICAQKSDVVWHITERIKEAREKYAGVNPYSYRSINVSLCYSEKFISPQPIEKIKKHTLGFVGTLSPNQGLQMVVRAVPELVKRFPDLRIEIIGSGFYEGELKKLIQVSPCRDRFIFHGFIKDEREVIRIISHTALGLATWTGDEKDYSLYADPGKPKLYAFCGLPTIITKMPAIAKEIEQWGAGVSIGYSEEEFIEAVNKILKDEQTLVRYRTMALKFAHRYTSELVFGKAWEETLRFIYET